MHWLLGRSTHWRTLAVVSLIVLAGCGSFVGGGGGGGGGDGATDDGPEAVTPAPVPEVTPTPDPWPVAPGLSAQGVVDVNALVDAHRAAIGNTSYEFTEWSGSASPPNATVPMFRQTRATVAGSSHYLVWTASEMIRLDGAITHVANYTEYVDPDARRVRYRLAGQSEPDFAEQYVIAAAYNDLVGERATVSILRYLTADDTEVARTTVDGERYYVVTGFERSPTANSRRNLSVRALVSSEGFVRSLNVSYVTMGVGELRRFRYRFAYEDVGETTLDPPPWVAEWNASQPNGLAPRAPELRPRPEVANP